MLLTSARPLKFKCVGPSESIARQVTFEKNSSFFRVCPCLDLNGCVSLKRQKTMLRYQSWRIESVGIDGFSKRCILNENSGEKERASPFCWKRSLEDCFRLRKWIRDFSILPFVHRRENRACVAHIEVLSFIFLLYSCARKICFEEKKSI